METQTVYLIDVRVPHLGEKTEGWWGVRVINREFDVSLGHSGELMKLEVIKLV